MSSRRIDLFAVQAHITLDDYASSSAFAAKMGSLCEQIEQVRERDRQGRFRYPALVVFPEDIGTFLLVSPYYRQIRTARTLDEALKRIAFRRLPRVFYHRARYHASTLRALFLMGARETYEVYYRTFSTLAQRHQLSVVAGSLLVPDNRFGATSTFQLEPSQPRLYNLSLTFDARGEVVHETRKVNLVRGLEDALELTPGTSHEQRPFEVCGARVGNMICQDGFVTGLGPAFVPIGPLLVQQGAEILTQPSANLLPWAERWPLARPERPITQGEAWMEQGLLGLMRALPSILYGINPMLNGGLLGIRFEGQSTILGRGGEGEPIVLACAERFGDGSEVETILKVEASLPARSRLRPPAVMSAPPFPTMASS